MINFLVYFTQTRETKLSTYGGYSFHHKHIKYYADLSPDIMSAVSLLKQDSTGWIEMDRHYCTALPFMYNF